MNMQYVDGEKTCIHAATLSVNSLPSAPTSFSISFGSTHFPLSLICFLPFSFGQIENYIKESMKTEMAQLQQSAVHNHTAAMLEMGTNLLSQTAEQTRKLTDVETQVTPKKTIHMSALKCASRSHSLSHSLLTSFSVFERIHPMLH